MKVLSVFLYLFSVLATGPVCAEEDGFVVSKTILDVEVAIDRTTIEWANQEGEGLFTVRGYIYPAGTLEGDDGIILNEDGKGMPEFPGKVIGRWLCQAWFGQQRVTVDGNVVSSFSTQYFEMDVVGVGKDMLVTQGFELRFEGLSIKAVTGGTGKYMNFRGEQHQTLIGRNVTQLPNISCNFKKTATIQFKK